MFDSPATLAKMIDGINEKVIYAVSSKILTLLQERINIDVYGFPNAYAAKRNAVYYDGSGIATGEFLEAFHWDEIDIKLRDITRELFYDTSRMNYDPDTFLHGSRKYGDLREELSSLLNVEGIDEKNNFGGNIRHPYWDNFLKELFDDKKIDQMFDEEFLKFGITR
jgi:hypothetical protein